MAKSYPFVAIQHIQYLKGVDILSLEQRQILLDNTANVILQNHLVARFSWCFLYHLVSLQFLHLRTDYQSNQSGYKQKLENLIFLAKKSNQLFLKIRRKFFVLIVCQVYLDNLISLDYKIANPKQDLHPKLIFLL